MQEVKIYKSRYFLSFIIFFVSSIAITAYLHFRGYIVLESSTIVGLCILFGGAGFSYYMGIKEVAMQRYLSPWRPKPPEEKIKQKKQRYPQQQYPQRQYPQRQYPQQQYPQQQYPQQQYPQQQQQGYNQQQQQGYNQQQQQRERQR